MKRATARGNTMKHRDAAWFREAAGKVGMLMLVALLFHGCAPKRVVEYPGRPESVAAPTPRPRPQILPPAPAPAPLQAPELTPPPVSGPDSDSLSRRGSVPVPEEGKAAGALLAGARQQVRTGDYSQAEIMLERALRVEPRNARLWHEMAAVKFARRDYRQAVQFCIKSNSLAGKDYDLIQQNWLLMEKAYIELGEPEKARQARIKSG